MLEQSHWHNMDRAILVSVDDVAFTFAATPFYLSYILYSIYELTANWKGWRDAQEEQSILFGIFCPSVGTAWTYTQAVDAFTDLAALLGYCMHYPAWFSSSDDLQLLGHHAARCQQKDQLLTWAVGDVSEFMVYSAALSVLSVVESGMLLLSREFACREGMYSAAGANIFETTAKVYFVQLGTPPDWVLAQPDNAGFSDSQKQ
ncbi:unnamed protein product [Symbiodinium sp. KB8]|nr:unnamed protein product [Symbiodinium sp. KB8]